jgi:flagellar motor switch protein FliN
MNTSSYEPAGNPLYQVKTDLSIRIGSTKISVGELISAKKNQVIVLNHSLDQNVDLIVEGHTVARGQLVVVQNKFAIKITELPLGLNHHIS